VLPVIALVGRPNVGKSTLFNRLTGTRDALVADYPGLTRDRLYGYAQLGADTAIVIDTGGITGQRAVLDERMAQQVRLAVDEAHVIVLLVDCDAGCTPGDELVAELVRRAGKPVIVAVNKAEGRPAPEAVAEFHALGFGEPEAISATRGDRVETLAARALSSCPPDLTRGTADTPAAGTRIAVIGRPNVGKSTLINRYLGEERLLTMDEAGTTRDSIAVPFRLGRRDMILVDTAGIRRRAKVAETIEKFSVVKSLQALEESDAVIVLLDAREGVTEQDVSLLGLVVERGRALTLGVNKWDGLDESARAAIRRELDRRLPFLDFVDVHFVSARHGSNVMDLLKSAARAADAAARDLPTPRLNQVLQASIQAHPPPIAGRSRIKLSYAHQGGKRPPVVVVHGNQTARLPQSYRRYLINSFRRAFRLSGTPVRLELRSSQNPYAGRRNPFTPRQLKRRQRVRRRKDR
jgi:GTP-binding protein